MNQIPNIRERALRHKPGGYPPASEFDANTTDKKMAPLQRRAMAVFRYLTPDLCLFPDRDALRVVLLGVDVPAGLVLHRIEALPLLGGTYFPAGRVYAQSYPFRIRRTFFR